MILCRSNLLKTSSSAIPRPRTRIRNNITIFRLETQIAGHISLYKAQWICLVLSNYSNPNHFLWVSRNVLFSFHVKPAEAVCRENDRISSLNWLDAEHRTKIDSSYTTRHHFFPFPALTEITNSDTTRQQNNVFIVKNLK